MIAKDLVYTAYPRAAILRCSFGSFLSKRKDHTKADRILLWALLAKALDPTESMELWGASRHGTTVSN